MGVTLEQLLNEPVETEKTASIDAPPDGSDLIDALRKHAADDNIAIREQAVQELTEKTAEIVVIQKALQEIDKVASLGMPSDRHREVATFIKVALDKGHSEEEIAEFFQKEALITPTLAAAGAVGAGGALLGKAALGAGKKFLKARKLKKVEKGISRTAAKGRKVEDKVMEGLRRNVASPEYLSRFEAAHGTGKLKIRLEMLADEGMKMPAAAKKYLPSAKGGPVSEPGWKFKTPGGKEVSVTKEQAKRYGIPAAYAGGGVVGGRALLGGGKKKDNKKSGVVVINR